MACPAFSTTLLLVIGWLGPTAMAVSIEFVSVADPGNAPDTRYNGIAVGSVGYTFQIGKFEVTTGQYCEFLNAVAATDTYGLYNYWMDAARGGEGCNIKRSGTSGNYTYSVASDWANRPVNWNAWSHAARFVNWLSNGQPPGAQSLATTEDGSYYLNGANDFPSLAKVTRKPNATYVVPTQDEWYKAAYYDPQKPGGAGYWDYPTRSNVRPSNRLDAGGPNNANYDSPDSYPWDDYTIGAPYYRTEVGAFASSASPYGTFDQGGNVWELTETPAPEGRYVRGGAYGGGSYDRGLRAATGVYVGDPTGFGYHLSYVGFRIAYVPEPATLALLVVGLAAVRCVHRW